MRLVVFSHKICWPCKSSQTGYATDGGFAFQMKALSEIFTDTTILVPCLNSGGVKGEIHLSGHNLKIVPLSVPQGSGFKRKLALPFWLIRNHLSLVREFFNADVIHTPIPGDIGTIGAAMALFFRKRLFVRYCQNWYMPKSIADRTWIRSIERFAGGRNVVLTTGGSEEPPSYKNKNIKWIFATTLTEKELAEYSSGTRHLNNDTIRLTIVCRQERGKGVGTLIKSIPLIKKEFTNVSLDVVGDGQMLTEFKKIAADNNVKKNVCFHGRVDHQRVLQILKKSDLFCFPTRSEGFPKSVIEALACGLPVLTTRVSVLPYLIKGCGTIIETVTPEAIANGVKQCLNDPKRYAKMSEQAMCTAKQYSLEQWRKSIREILNNAWGTLS